MTESSFLGELYLFKDRLSNYLFYLFIFFSHFKLDNLLNLLCYMLNMCVYTLPVKEQ